MKSLAIFLCFCFFHPLWGQGTLYKNDEGYHPIHYAGYNSKEITKFLIEKDPSLLWERSPHGDLPIHMSNDLLFIQWMVEKEPKLLRAKDACGRIPIQCASATVAEWMLSKDPTLIKEFKTHHSLAHIRPSLLKKWCEEDESRLEQKDEYGALPIHAAVECSEALAKWMIMKKPSLLWAKDDSGRLPVHRINYYDGVSTNLLLWMVDKDPKILVSQDDNGCLPIHDANWDLYQFEPLGQNLPYILKEIIEKDPSFIDVKGKEGNSLLHLAGCKWLVSLNPDLLYTSNNVGDLPIHTWCHCPETLKWMIKKDRKLLYAKNGKGELPIEICYNTDIILWMIKQDPKLLSSANLSHLSLEMTLPLIRENASLCKKWGKSIVNVLFNTGNLEGLQKIAEIDPSLLDDIPFNYLIGSEQNEIIKWMVQRNPALFWEKSEEGVPIISYCQDLPLLKWIAEKEPKLFSPKLGYGQSFFNCALARTFWYSQEKAHRHFKQLEWLLEEYPDSIDSVDEKGNTPLHFAAIKGDLLLAKKIYSMNPELLKKENHGGSLPFHKALRRSNNEVCYWMTKKAPGLLFTPDKKGRYPIHLANYHNTELVKWILRQAPNQIYNRHDSNLPIHFAIDTQNLELIKWIIEKEPRFTRETVKGNSIYHVAALCGDLLTFEMLFNHREISRLSNGDLAYINPGIIEELSGQKGPAPMLTSSPP